MAQPQPKYPVNAIAMGPSRFLKIPRQNYQLEWKNDSQLIQKIQNLLSHRMSFFQDQKVMTKAPLDQKIAALLINLFEKNTNSQEFELPLPITRKELADSLGVASESVIRVMSEWSKQGLIQTNDNYITLLKPEKIIEILKKQ